MAFIKSWMIQLLLFWIKFYAIRSLEDHTTEVMTVPHLAPDKKCVIENFVINYHRRWIPDHDVCLKILGDLAHPNSSTPHCPARGDGVMCWPATPVDCTIYQRCPEVRLLDVSKFTSRVCANISGRALWRTQAGTYDEVGWSDYSACFPPPVRDILDQMPNLTARKNIARKSRYFELSGLTISLLALLISITIFLKFKSLQCPRTKIHINLFVAISLHIVSQLVVNLDELVALNTGQQTAGISTGGLKTLKDSPLACIIVKRVWLEYTKTVMFMWMFVEGLYLHNTLVFAVFSTQPNYLLYYIICWAGPLPVIFVWALFTGLNDDYNRCWFGYTFRKLYYILDVPRVTVIFINLIFLLNIMRVLLTKLRDSHSTDTLRVRKAVKAALVLLPLLGINNALNLVDYKTKDVKRFAAWQFFYIFMISYQGFFIALLYCFINGEVQDCIKKAVTRFRLRRGYFGVTAQAQTQSCSLDNKELKLESLNNPQRESLQNDVEKAETLVEYDSPLIRNNVVTSAEVEVYNEDAHTDGGVNDYML